MPYKQTAAIQIKGELAQELDKYRGDGESWNNFMIRVLELIKENSAEDDTTQG